jgi:PilZ domain
MTTYDHGHKKAPGEKPADRKTSVSEADRRNTDRHAVTVSAEVVELSSGARFSTRTTDLGPGGCFVDTMVPFPVGASVRVKIRRGQSDFESQGIVVYSQSGIGMGIAFDSMEPHQREALDIWLIELTGGRHSTPHDARKAPTAPTRRASDRGSENSAAVIRLVRLMITKGILTEAEGSSIFRDPLL